MLRPHQRSTGGARPGSTAADSIASAIALPEPPADAVSLDMRGGRVLVDRASGGLVRATAAEARQFLAGTGGRGLVRIAAPLPDYPSHYVELGTHGAPAIRERAGGLTLVHERL
jgi:hypothetical protein